MVGLRVESERGRWSGVKRERCECILVGLNSSVEYYGGLDCDGIRLWSRFDLDGANAVFPASIGGVGDVVI